MTSSVGTYLAAAAAELDPVERVAVLSAGIVEMAAATKQLREHRVTAIRRARDAGATATAIAAAAGVSDSYVARLTNSE